MTTSDNPLVARFEAALPKMLEEAGAFISCESPSSDLDALGQCAELFASLASPYLKAEPEFLVVDGCPHLRWRLGPQRTDRRVLLVGHLDTVWPIGSLATHPCAMTEGVLRGPGCFDMKVGLIQTVHALAALDDSAGVTLLVTSDEELGSMTSRRLIEEEAARSVAAFVTEPSGDHGAVKVARKGTSMYQVEVRGVAAHAGLAPHTGVNASIEAAHQILAVHALNAPEIGTTVTPTVIAGGTTTNTVPARATIEVDVRVATRAEQERIDRDIRTLQPVLPGAQVTLHGGPNRPPMDRAQAEPLFALAVQEAETLGLGPIRGISVGGASDGNFTAGAGTPTLDGLGAVGSGAHADHEHVIVAAIPGQTALLSALVARVLAG